jgi:hypothetical protein
MPAVGLVFAIDFSPSDKVQEEPHSFHKKSIRFNKNSASTVQPNAFRHNLSVMRRDLPDYPTPFTGMHDSGRQQRQE